MSLIHLTDANDAIQVQLNLNVNNVKLKNSTASGQASGCALLLTAGSAIDPTATAYSGVERNSSTGDIIISASDNSTSANTNKYSLKGGSNSGLAVSDGLGTTNFWLTAARGGAPAGLCSTFALSNAVNCSGLTVVGTPFFIRVCGMVAILATVQVTLTGAAPTFDFACDQMTTTYADANQVRGIACFDQAGATANYQPNGLISSVTSTSRGRITLANSSYGGALNGQFICIAKDSSAS